MFFGNEGEAPACILALEDYPSLRIVRLQGPINQKAVAEIERFRKWVVRQRSFKHKHVLLDFKNVTEMDTAAVAGIIQEVSELKAARFRLGVIHLNEEVRGMFEVLKVEKLIVFYDNESEALEDLTHFH